MKRPAPDGYRWVSCPRDVHPVIAAQRHLLPLSVTPDAHAGVTACGACGMPADVWTRTNSRKLDCPKCLAVVARRTTT